MDLKSKGQGLSLNMIIIALIVLIVLVIVILIVTGGAGKFKKNVSDCGAIGGTCVPPQDQQDGQCPLNEFRKHKEELTRGVCGSATDICCSPK